MGAVLRRPGKRARPPMFIHPGAGDGVQPRQPARTVEEFARAPPSRCRIFRPNDRGEAHDPAHRPAPDRAAAAVRPRSRRRRRRPGADGRQVRRDVDVHELHVPVVQLPRPPGRAAVLRPGREHRRARSSATSSSSRRRSTRCSPARSSERQRPTPARWRASRARATRSTSSPAARARCLQDSHGQAVERRLRLLLGRPGRGSDAQLLPRDRRAQQQAARSTRWSSTRRRAR